MQVERLAESKRLRTEGERDAGALRNKAHIESQTILSQGREEASRILAAADKEAGRMLADAYQQDADFYKFWLSLQASKKLLANKPTLIFRTDQAPFNVLTDDPQPIPSTAPDNSYQDLTPGRPSASVSPPADLLLSKGQEPTKPTRSATDPAAKDQP